MLLQTTVEFREIKLINTLRLKKNNELLTVVRLRLVSLNKLRAIQIISKSKK